MNVEAMVTASKSLGDIDKANYFLQELETQGIKVSDLEMAFRLKHGPAAPALDPAISQSIAKLINILKT